MNVPQFYIRLEPAFQNGSVRSHGIPGGSKTNKMALLNWILLIAVLAMVAHEQPLTSFTNNVLVFTNTTCSQVSSSWGTLVTHAKWLDARILAWELWVAKTMVSYAAVPEECLRWALKFLSLQLRSNRILDYMCH